MPDADGFPTPDEIINGTAGTPPPAPAPAQPPTADSAALLVHLPPGMAADAVPPEMLRAVALVLSGLPFVLVAMRPTEPRGDGFAPTTQARATGSDFLTVLHGDRDVLQAVRDALPGVVERLYTRNGLV